jgi:hypothetical protein
VNEHFAAEDGRSPVGDTEIARIVLELDREIILARRAVALHHIVQGNAVALPVKPTTVEMGVFTTLARTFGWALLQHDFGSLREHLAKRGAVEVVQRALWGDQPEDQELADRLEAARISLEWLCEARPDVFMAEAHIELQGFRPRPPEVSD